MFRSFNVICGSPTRQLTRQLSSRLTCPTISSTTLKQNTSIEAPQLERVLDDWRNAIIQLQDDSDRLQWQLECLNKKLEERTHSYNSRESYNKVFTRDIY
jgi:uncharacterized coiled-coil protein SlyX